jgi:hypothetical protein
MTSGTRRPAEDGDQPLGVDERRTAAEPICLHRRRRRRAMVGCSAARKDNGGHYREFCESCGINGKAATSVKRRIVYDSGSEETNMPH